MARYIDVEDFSQMVYENFGRDGEYDYRDLIRILREQPTADVKEVVRGEWVHPKNESDPLWHLCSNCGKGQNQKFDVAKRYQNEWAGEIWFFPFCPYCGADMREGEK